MKYVRKNAGLLLWARGAAFAAVTWLALWGTHSRPLWGLALLSAVVGVFGYVLPELGVLAAIIVISIPLIAANPVVGILFLVIGAVSTRYLGGEGGRTFLLVALAVVGAFLGPVWAAAALAGLLLGAGEGAIVAALACVTIEVLGLLLGRPGIGVTATGGSTAILAFDAMPASLLSAQWVKDAFASLNGVGVDRFIGVFAGVKHGAVLLLQPIVWASAALATGYLRTMRVTRRNALLGLVPPAVGVSIAVAATSVLRVTLSLGQSPTALVAAFVASLAVALAFTAVWDQVFRLVPVASKGGALGASMAEEDADVDELLRLIATAEDKLASQHTTQRVVMITDMKSFSRMTEEDGSMMTAKAIQRHRDLLLPVIERHGGKGKSTGGDGLVAAFDDQLEAVKAAVEMQQALHQHNISHPSERDMWVRIGVASGEVVLDKGGRPFIGSALNLAARVMNLGDGGQAFATAAVAESAAAAGLRVHSFGQYSLKNIGSPVEVIELLWGEDQEPLEPRESSEQAEA